MIKKIVFGGLLMTVAVGGPASWFRLSDFWRDLSQGTVWDNTSGKSTETATTSETLKPVGKASATGSSYSNSTVTSLEGLPTPGIAEVLRFDVSPAWVLQRWPRVSTDLAHLQLHGYRVPLVTGTNQTDVAGSLTYYFNSAQQVQQITLRGSTGDPRTLISFLSTRYGYVRRPNNDPSRLVFESVNSSGKTMGTMIVQSAPVVRADRPYQRYALELSMNKE